MRKRNEELWAKVKELYPTMTAKENPRLINQIGEKSPRYKKEDMLIIIGALFYSLGIYVGRNWNKITRE